MKKTFHTLILAAVSVPLIAFGTPQSGGSGAERLEAPLEPLAEVNQDPVAHQANRANLAQAAKPGKPVDPIKQMLADRPAQQV